MNCESKIGKKFGRVKVVALSEPYVSPKGFKKIKVQCVCDCGRIFIVLWASLKSGHTRSCGCLKLESDKAPNLGTTKHGMSGTPEYSIYKGMKSRCYNSNNKAFEYYGGRGIKVCERWLESFQNFYEDMGPMPENHSIERIDNNLGYGPSNCKWIPLRDQSKNQRLCKANTSGTTGVFYHKNSDAWEVIWTQNGTRKTKWFGKKYGDNKKEAAVAFRENVVNPILIEQGYGESHGK